MARILMVEDNADNRIIYGMLLTHLGHEVFEAVDGETGVRMAGELRPDVILMDISLPRMSGWEATEILKKTPETSSIPVIALTAHAFAQDRLRGEALGFAEYLAKPIEPRLVVEAVARVLAEPAIVVPPAAG